MACAEAARRVTLRAISRLMCFRTEVQRAARKSAANTMFQPGQRTISYAAVLLEAPSLFDGSSAAAAN